jgi:prevent-host-death family protein
VLAAFGSFALIRGVARGTAPGAVAPRCGCSFRRLACYICYVAAEKVPARVITHRELRNNSSEVLRAVQAGEIIEVTNHGSAAAILVPPSLTPYERLLAAGKVRLTEVQPVDLRCIPRASQETTTAEVLADLRGDR